MSATIRLSPHDLRSISTDWPYLPPHHVAVVQIAVEKPDSEWLLEAGSDLFVFEFLVSKMMHQIQASLIVTGAVQVRHACTV